MAYTNETTHYGIPLPLGSDLTTPMDYNTAMQEVDTDLFTAKTDSGSALQKANQLQQDLSTTNDNVTSVAGRVTTLEGTVTTQGGAILQNTQDIADVRADALDMIEAVDEGTAQVATVAVTKGDYFRYNDVLYFATEDIAIGDTIIPNTNCTATNVGTELTKIKSDLSDFDDVHGSSILGVGESKVLVANNPTAKYLVISFNTSEQQGTSRGCVVMPKRTMSGWFPLYCNGELMSVRLDYTNATNTFQFIDINKTQTNAIYVTNIFE